jgi:predicted GIY-YIG superfamily endonuclease
MTKGVVYLLHFNSPISDKHTSQHYIGWAKDLSKRLEHHRSGTGSRFCAIAAERNISFIVSATWEDQDKNFERLLKNRKNAKRLCPICKNSK